MRQPKFQWLFNLVVRTAIVIGAGLLVSLIFRDMHPDAPDWAVAMMGWAVAFYYVHETKDSEAENRQATWAEAATAALLRLNKWAPDHVAKEFADSVVEELKKRGLGHG